MTEPATKKKGWLGRLLGGGGDIPSPPPEVPQQPDLQPSPVPPELPPHVAPSPDIPGVPEPQPGIPVPPGAPPASPVPPAPEPPDERALDDQAADEQTDAKIGWFKRIRQGLSRSSTKLSHGITDLFSKRRLDEAALEELEELLITADLGVATASRVTARLAKARFDQEVSPDEVKGALAEEIAQVLEPVAVPLIPNPDRKPHVVLVVGVNGSGKTTTIGKLAKYFRDQRLSVTLAAGDTFRAAAVEQLKVWGERTDCPVIARENGADAAGLAFDALKEAQRRQDDLLLIDTAGRLQNKADLMAELQKIVRVLRKHDAEAPHDVLLVLDATVGQNAHSQVEIFKDMTDVSGLILTKLDGTARGGVLVALAEKFKLPVHAIGVGEGADDLRPFEAKAFARGLLDLD